jgi:V/A-type H+/Na+-transporting ATPase subunit D
VILKVSATRMEMLRLRKRTALAKHGHRLLKEKQDELSRQLVALSRTVRQLREEVERELAETARRFVLARAAAEPEDTKAALLLPNKKLSVAVTFANVMNVRVPEFAKEVAGEIFCYGFACTSGELDASLVALDRVLDRLLDLAEREKKILVLAHELRRTRRRVNVLENVVIPNLQDTLRYIASKLEEIERDNISRLMRVAEVIR